MATARIHISTKGLDEMIKALDDISTKGIPRAQRELDAALDRTAETSRALAHEHEGALKASQSHSSYAGPSSWSGQIAYTARGAEWEMQRGGDHDDFIDSLTGLSHDAFVAALDATFTDL